MKSLRSCLEATAVTETAVVGVELGEDTLSAADSSEALQGLLDLLGGMGGHAAGAEHCLAHRDGEVNHGIGVDAVFEQRFPEHHGAVLVADVYRNNRCLGAADVEPHVAQSLPPLGSELVQAVYHLGFALQHIQGSEGSGGGSWRKTGAEDEGAAEVLYPVEHLARAGNEAANGSE